MVVVVCLCTLAWPLMATPEGIRVSMTVVAGYEGRAKAGQWMPVTVTLQNDGAEISGEVQFTSRRDMGPFTQKGIFAQPVTIPAGGTKRVTLYMPAEFGATPPVELVVKGEKVAEATSAPVITAELLVGVLGVEPAELSGLTGVEVGGRTVRLVALASDSLPTEPLALQSLDAILLDRFAYGELPPPQRAALEGWVEHGGLLIAAGGPEVRRLAPISPWLDLTVTGVEETQLPGIGKASLARIQADGWRAVSRASEQALVYQRTKGAGTVYLLTFDPALEPFASWHGLKPLWSDLFSRVPGVATGWAQMNGTQMFRSGNFPIEVLRQLPVGEPPTPRALVTLLAVYALVVGPVHLLLLRAFRRLGWALLTLPLLAMAGAGTAWAYTAQNRGSDLSGVSLSVQMGQPDGKSLLVRGVAGIYLAPGSSHRAEVGGGLLWPMPSPPMAPMVPQSNVYSNQGEMRIEGGRTALLDGKEEWQLSSIAAEALIPVEGTVASELVLKGNEVTGWVRNDLPFALRDVVVVVGGNSHSLGHLEPGATAEITMGGIAMDMGQGPNRMADAMSRSLDMGIIGPQGPTPAQMAMMLRQQVLWPLLSAAGWSDGTPTPKVAVAAWTDAPGLPISADGREIRSGGASLYLQPLSYRYSAEAFGLPPAFVDLALVESNVGMNQPPYWGWGLPKDGSATLEQLVPVELVDRVTDLELRVPVMEKMPGTEPGYELHLYRWRDGAWVERPLNEAIRMKVAEGFMNDDGRLRYRVVKRDDSHSVLGAPVLSVEGRAAR